MPPNCTRRTAIALAAGLVVTSGRANSQSRFSQSRFANEPDRKWYDAAASMKRLAQSWGDQPYGAVVVLDDQLVGEGPSRVVKNQDSTAHAEREAIRDAQRSLGRASLSGAVLYSTSRPCNLCEAAAAQAGIRRMYFGPMLADAGTPSAGTQ